MVDTPEKNSGVEEEPQVKRGPKGARSAGSDRASGTSVGRSGTSVQPERTQDRSGGRLSRG
ncbi:hypothetical protein [Streptomyces sp. NPDC001880]